MQQKGKPWRRRIAAHSGDSHFLEPEDLFQQILPPALAERMPRSVKEDGWETVYIDGEQIRRPLPKPIRDGEFAGETIVTLSVRPPGAGNVEQRVKDLDQEGIWAEVTSPLPGHVGEHHQGPDAHPRGLQGAQRLGDVRDPGEGARPAARDRHAPVARRPGHRRRGAPGGGSGYKAVFIPTVPPPGRPTWNSDEWEPVWQAIEETGLVLAIHIGTDGETVDVPRPRRRACSTTSTPPSAVSGPPRS